MKKDLTEADLPGLLVDELRHKGYCIMRNEAIGRVHALARDLEPIFAATPFCEGNFYGRRTKRFGSLLKRSPHMADLVLNPIILSAVETILGTGCDRIQLNLTQAIEIHPGEVRQFPHRDHDMWRGADGTQEYLVNVLWPLTPFTKDNGATRIFPESHGVKGMAKSCSSPLPNAHRTARSSRASPRSVTGFSYRGNSTRRSSPMWKRRSKRSQSPSPMPSRRRRFAISCSAITSGARMKRRTTPGRLPGIQAASPEHQQPSGDALACHRRPELT
ncbi:phytanoyl-CoA dioxygenase family protein [Sphingopyxis sp. OPL5]|uniref:phytanoyl-CoA dioxygenase family protein n=1 Tax=Sphingopyxis sp. OPL5 TaxID=2486273 RepID=UPI00223AC612|nr:phytanoyl-CoA dioxygenase family protein [Sphingopyxis sp. OPL5]